jgi:hypothetical protein
MGGKTQAGMFLCNVCRNKFTVRTGTVMERSHVPLHKWLLATHLMAASKKGMSAKQIERMMGVTYKTAWFLCTASVRRWTKPTTRMSPLGGEGKTIEATKRSLAASKRSAFRKVAPKKKIVDACRARWSRPFVPHHQYRPHASFAPRL